MQTLERPVLLVVDGDGEVLQTVADALIRRFGTDYRMLTTTDPQVARDILANLSQNGAEVALVIAALWLPQVDGATLLGEVRLHHPGAERALLIPMGDATATGPAQQASTLGQIDLTIVAGWESPEEWFYPQVQQALSSWWMAHRPRHEHIRLIGEQWSPRCHELRDLLTRSMIPFGFYDAASETGKQLLNDHQLSGSPLPVMLLFDGRAIINPSNAEFAELMGVRTRPDTGVYDVAILGAGPGGLAAAVYAASEGLRTVVIEPGALGGQAGSSSMIRNYPGFPRGISGGELTYRAYEQAVLFGAEFVFANQAVGISADGNERRVLLSDGSELVCRSLIIATGVSYRRLGIPALDRLVGMGVFYGAAMAEAPAMAGHDVCVVGGANSAGQAALHLARFARKVTMLVRGDCLEAGMSDYLVKQIKCASNIEVCTGTAVIDGQGGHRLETLVVEDRRTGQRATLETTATFVMIGAEPHTDWLSHMLQRTQNGYIETGDELSRVGWPLRRPPMTLETSLPGVFAIGDVRSGAVKRVVSAVGDGGTVIGLVHRYLAELTSAPAREVARSRG